MLRPILLMTRPQEASKRFVAGLSAELRDGLDVIYAPLMEIVFEAQSDTLPLAKGVIFTSANGVGASEALFATDIRQSMRAHCVGRRTQNCALQAGWLPGVVAENAETLVKAMISARPETPLLHLRGRHTRGDIATRLSAAGLPCNECQVYDQRLLPLTLQAKAALDASTAVIVPVFSPRSARHFAHCCRNCANLHLIAISDAAAEPLKRLKYKSLRVSKTPDAEAMRMLLRDAAGQLT